MGKLDTRERIMESALSLFSERGYEGSSTRDIAERAGVNEITLFRHFGSKENLFREVLASRAPTSLLTDDLNRRLTGNLHEDLTYLARMYLETEYKNLDFIRIGIMEVTRNPFYADLVHTIPMRMEEHLAKYLTDLANRHIIQGANFHLLSKMFYGQLFQHVMMICSFGDASGSLKAESEELVTTLVSMFVMMLHRQ